MRALLLALGLLFAFPAFAAADDARFDALLGRYVEANADGVNRVAYARWRDSRADRDELNAYIAELGGQRPSQFARERAFAYWVNLYNAVTLQAVLERYPVRSIRDIRSEGAGLDPRALVGPWRTKRVTVEGRELSLDDIEHGILRPQFRDARVHYAVNCASIGCPNLAMHAWRAESLEADLDAAARAFINHPRAVRVLANGGVRVSSIFRWFREDFGGADPAVLAHFRRHANPELARALLGKTRIASHGYDWALNEAIPSH